MSSKIRPFPEGGCRQLNKITREEKLRRGYFADPGYFIVDHCWLRHGGRWHVFYIRGRDTGLIDEEVGHASTPDFCEWTVHRPLPVEGAPTVIEHQGQFYLFSNRRAGVEERRGMILCTSRDLETWDVHRDGEPVYVPNADLYGWSHYFKHCRDYHIMRFEGGFLILFAEMTLDRIGCVGAIRSKDLLHWEDLGPIFLLDKTGRGFSQWSASGFGIPESPCMVEHGGQWHLWVTDNMVSNTLHLWSDSPLKGFSLDRCAYFIGSPAGWDDLSAGHNLPTAAKAGRSAAVEVFETDWGWLASYYYHDPCVGKRVLRCDPLVWHGTRPCLQLYWPR